MRQSLPDLGPRGEGWVVLQGVFFIALVAAGLLGPAGRAPARLVLAAGGAALVVARGSLAARGVVDLGDNLTVVPRPQDRARLVDRGAYRLVRHPIYGGLVLAAIGWGSSPRRRPRSPAASRSACSST